MPDTHANAAVIAVGDELALGQTLDTNSRWTAERLSAAGLSIIEHVTVPDERRAIAAALLRLSGAADLIVVTGGLGPTLDDLTRPALADAMGDELVEDAIAMAQIESYFTGSGREMPAINRVQARRPSRAFSLPNLVGTAPGLAGTIGADGRSCEVFCLPGPPVEMRPMFESQVIPRLRPAPGRTIRTRTLACFGIGESDLATRLGPLMDRARMPLVGTTASGGVVTCRLRYEGELPPADAEALLDETEAAIRRLAGAYIFGVNSPGLAHEVVALLRASGDTLGVVESCTGGLLGAMVTDVPGASAVFQAGLVTYSNHAKITLADVPGALLGQGGPGAVSPETAAAMALGGLRVLGVSHCLAVTGIAGPDGGTPGKPVGAVYVSCASRSLRGGPAIDTRGFRMMGDRAAIRDWSAKSALAMLRLALVDKVSTRLLRQIDD